MGKRELVALLNLSSWCLVMVEDLFLAVARGCLRFVIVVFPDHTHYYFFIHLNLIYNVYQCVCFCGKINTHLIITSRMSKNLFYPVPFGNCADIPCLKEKIPGGSN